MRVLRPLLLCLVFCARPVFADTMQVDSSKDNTIVENSPTLSNGIGEFFHAGRTGQVTNAVRRALLAFDVSSIPPGSTIDAVRVTLHMSRTNAGDEPVSFHRALTNWGEGTSNADFGEAGGAPATAGDATWQHAEFPAIDWNTLGGDFVASPSVTLAVGGIGDYVFGSTPELVADVQHWVDTPLENFGWLLKGNETGSVTTAKRFDSLQNADANLIPVLSVDFTTVDVGDRPISEVAHLAPGSPNPTPAGTSLSFRLGQAGRARIAIYDARGREVALVLAAELPAGEHHARWGGRTAAGSLAAPGAYWARLEFAGHTATRAFVVIR